VATFGTAGYPNNIRYSDDFYHAPPQEIDFINKINLTRQRQLEEEKAARRAEREKIRRRAHRASSGPGPYRKRREPSSSSPPLAETRFVFRSSDRKITN
jgi:hypothetical protein